MNIEKLYKLFKTSDEYKELSDSGMSDNEIKNVFLKAKKYTDNIFKNNIN